jgi:hypothetical protein
VHLDTTQASISEGYMMVSSLFQEYSSDVEWIDSGGDTALFFFQGKI